MPELAALRYAACLYQDQCMAQCGAQQPKMDYHSIQKTDVCWALLQANS